METYKAIEKATGYELNLNDRDYEIKVINGIVRVFDRVFGDDLTDRVAWIRVK